MARVRVDHNQCHVPCCSCRQHSRGSAPLRQERTRYLFSRASRVICVSQIAVTFARPLTERPNIPYWYLSPTSHWHFMPLQGRPTPATALNVSRNMPPSSFWLQIASGRRQAPPHPRPSSRPASRPAHQVSLPLITSEESSVLAPSSGPLLTRCPA